MALTSTATVDYAAARATDAGSARRLQLEESVLNNKQQVFVREFPPMKSIGQALMLAVDMGMFLAVLIVLHETGVIAF